MRKILSFVLVLAMMLSLLALSAYAAPGAGRRNRAAAKCTACTEFIDEDGDGSCDNCGFIDEDGDGVCDNCGFIDEDGDGICDNCLNGGVRPHDGRGRGAGRGCCGACRRG